MGQFSFLSVRYDSFLLGFRQLLFFFFKIKVYELTELGKRIGNLIGFLVLVNFAWIVSVGWLGVDFGFVDVFIHCAKKVSRIRMGSLGLFFRLGLAYEFVEREFPGLKNYFQLLFYHTTHSLLLLLPPSHHDTRFRVSFYSETTFYLPMVVVCRYTVRNT